MNSTDFALIITGCVSPSKNIYALGLTDSKIRLNQYIDSIKYYIVDSDAHYIVFCENSNFDFAYEDLNKYASENGKKLEILRYKGDSKKVIEQGKGYGEGEILEYAIKHSEIVKQVSYIYKITGRIIVKNFDEIVKKEKKESIYFNNNLYSYNSLDTRFWGMPKDLYVDLFMKQYYKVNDEKLRFIEHVFFETINKTVLVYNQHPLFPILEGISGTMNSSYKESKPYYTIWFKHISKYGLFNNKFFYSISYIFLHMDRIWKDVIHIVFSRLYHYYAEIVVRIKKAFIVVRTVVYHYYAEIMVRIKKIITILWSFLYHIFAEGMVRAKKVLILIRTKMYHQYATKRIMAKNIIKSICIRLRDIKKK